MGILQHDKYIGAFVYDTEEDCFCGEVINMEDVIHFRARNVNELPSEMMRSIEAHLEACRSRGVEVGPPKPLEDREMHAIAEARTREVMRKEAGGERE